MFSKEEGRKTVSTNYIYDVGPLSYRKKIIEIFSKEEGTKTVSTDYIYDVGPLLLIKQYHISLKMRNGYANAKAACDNIIYYFVIHYATCCRSSGC